MIDERASIALDISSIVLPIVLAAIFFYVLWGVIRSAVLAALRKHAAEQTEASNIRRSDDAS